MLVDPRPSRREVLGPTLTAEGFDIIACVSPEDDLLGAVARYSPDLVLIDIDSPSRDTLEALRTVQAEQPRPMVMFTQDDVGESIRRAADAGVTAYLVDGLENRRVRPILDAAMVRFTQYRALEQELADTRNKLEERKLIERAKGLIMKQQGADEAAAYQAMRKLATRKNK
jgi:response regulator NasT